LTKPLLLTSGALPKALFKADHAALRDASDDEFDGIEAFMPRDRTPHR
jgi:hypothetical protein